MLAFKQVRFPARLSIGTLAVFILSLLLHAVALRTISTVGEGSKRHAPTPPPVIVQLQPRVPAAVPAAPTASKEAPKKKPRRKRVAKAAPPKPPPESPPQSSPAPLVAPLPPPMTDVDAATLMEFLSGSAESTSTATPEADLAETGNPGLAADPESASIDAAEEPVPPAHAVDPPPAAELRYAVEAIRKDGSYYGSGKIQFLREDGGYTIRGEAKLLFFSVLEFSSAGTLDARGLHPVIYSEKPFRRSMTNTHFHRERDLISFSASAKTYPRLGGEQDRASIVWQLAAIGRGDPSQLQTGREITLFVAGVRDGEPWVLRVIGEETVEADGDPVSSIHVQRLPRPGSYQQKLDIWLAPAMQWYPVKLRFTETNGDYLELSLSDAPVAVSSP